jgi:hypothetical protein
MTHISRPFQIALVAMALFVAVWFVALRGHSSGSEGAGSSASRAAGPAAAPAKAAGSGGSSSGGSVYHGSAPGVEGLTRAITKAQGAVAQSQQNAKQLQEKSAQASSASSAEASGQQSKAPSRASSSAGSKAGSPAASATKSQASAASGKAAAQGSGATRHSDAKAGAPTHSGAASGQATIEGELKQGKVAAILFWNPKSSVDAIVHRELLAAGHALGGKLAVHAASSKQVGSFGSFTRTVQVYSTPTILMVNTKGQTSSVTGLTDVFSIEQAVKEVKQAQR